MVGIMNTKKLLYLEQNSSCLRKNLLFSQQHRNVFVQFGETSGCELTREQEQDSCTNFEPQRKAVINKQHFHCIHCKPAVAIASTPSKTPPLETKPTHLNSHQACSNKLLLHKHRRHRNRNPRLLVHPLVHLVNITNDLVPLARVPLLVGAEVCAGDLGAADLVEDGDAFGGGLELFRCGVEGHDGGVERGEGGEALELVHCGAAEAAGLDGPDDGDDENEYEMRDDQMRDDVEMR